LKSRDQFCFINISIQTTSKSETATLLVATGTSAAGKTPLFRIGTNSQSQRRSGLRNLP